MSDKFFAQKAWVTQLHYKMFLSVVQPLLKVCKLTLLYKTNGPDFIILWEGISSINHSGTFTNRCFQIGAALKDLCITLSNNLCC